MLQSIPSHYFSAVYFIFLVPLQFCELRYICLAKNWFYFHVFNPLAVMTFANVRIREPKYIENSKSEKFTKYYNLSILWDSCTWLYDYNCQHHSEEKKNANERYCFMFESSKKKKTLKKRWLLSATRLYSRKQHTNIERDRETRKMIKATNERTNDWFVCVAHSLHHRVFIKRTHKTKWTF